MIINHSETLKLDVLFYISDPRFWQGTKLYRTLLLCLEKIALVLEPFVNTGDVVVFRNI